MGVLYVLPLAVLLSPDPDWQRLLWHVPPANAGLAVQATANLASLPLSPWAGLGVLTAWGAAALLAGGCCFRVRDVNATSSRLPRL
jgi:ABC-2 type transport system permease protein